MTLDATPKLMGDFFDFVSSEYDKVHTANIDGGAEYYRAISDPVKPTDESLQILNIGCGSGLEMPHLFKNVPNSHIHCIDLSEKMLDKMEERFSDTSYKISTSVESYLDFQYPQNKYDYIIASATLHHLLNHEKSPLFSKILESLKSEGVFILGDYFVSPKEAETQLELYKELQQKGVDVSDGKYHIDIPTTSDNDLSLLENTGYINIKKVWKSSNFSIFSAQKSV